MLDAVLNQTAEEFQLKETIALNHRVDRESILLFGTHETFLEELLRAFYAPQSKLILAAPTVPEIAIAADRAEIEYIDTFSIAPFAANTESLTSSIQSTGDIIYLANPNRLTGATHSNLDLKQLAKSVSNGLLVIDEYFADFSGLSSLALTGLLPNLVVLKTFENWSNSARNECGYAVVSEELIEILGDRFSKRSLDRGTAKKCLEVLRNKKDTISRVAQIQKQALETSTALSSLGVQCQITPTDQIVIHTDDAKSIQKQLLSHDVNCDLIEFSNTNLSFLLYRVTRSESSNELVQSFMRILSNTVSRKERQAITV